MRLIFSEIPVSFKNAQKISHVIKLFSANKKTCKETVFGCCVFFFFGRKKVNEGKMKRFLFLSLSLLFCTWKTLKKIRSDVSGLKVTCEPPQMISRRKTFCYYKHFGRKQKFERRNINIWPETNSSEKIKNMVEQKCSPKEWIIE